MFNSIISNSRLKNNLKLYYLTKIKHSAAFIGLDPSINARKVYILHLKNIRYHKLHYLYLYYINLSLISEL